jgi:hypothetical protein
MILSALCKGEIDGDTLTVHLNEEVKPLIEKKIRGEKFMQEFKERMHAK